MPATWAQIRDDERRKIAKGAERLRKALELRDWGQLRALKEEGFDPSQFQKPEERHKKPEDQFNWVGEAFSHGSIEGVRELLKVWPAMVIEFTGFQLLAKWKKGAWGKEELRQALTESGGAGDSEMMFIPQGAVTLGSDQKIHEERGMMDALAELTEEGALNAILKKHNPHPEKIAGREIVHSAWALWIGAALCAGPAGAKLFDALMAKAPKKAAVSDDEILWRRAEMALSHGLASWAQVKGLAPYYPKPKKDADIDRDLAKRFGGAGQRSEWAEADKKSDAVEALATASVHTGAHRDLKALWVMAFLGKNQTAAREAWLDESMCSEVVIEFKTKCESPKSVWRWRMEATESAGREIGMEKRFAGVKKRIAESDLPEREKEVLFEELESEPKQKPEVSEKDRALVLPMTKRLPWGALRIAVIAKKIRDNKSDAGNLEEGNWVWFLENGLFEPHGVKESLNIARGWGRWGLNQLGAKGKALFESLELADAVKNSGQSAKTQPQRRV